VEKLQNLECFSHILEQIVEIERKREKNNLTNAFFEKPKN